MIALDETDRNILRQLQQEGRASVASLADRIGLSEAPAWRRVRKLEEEGYILGYHASVSRRALGLDVHAIVSVRFSSHDLSVADRFAEAIQAMPEVMSCHNVTGDVDYILDVVTQDLATYERFSLKLRSIPGVTSMQTHLSLREIKSSHILPV